MAIESKRFLNRWTVSVLVIIDITVGQRDYTTPVPILKQLNRHNEDGSYSYGYEGADGSFKIETKYPNGEVYGKYGYVDDSGKLREVEYGASKRGFEPQGNDINVPPPTLTNSNPNITPIGPNEEDDGQYREDPSVYYHDQKRYNSKPATASNFRLNNPPQPAPQYNQPQSQNYNPAHQPVAPAQYNPAHQPVAPTPPRFQQTYPQQNYNSAPPSYYNNVVVPNNHHPALQNIDIYSGSYSVSYTGR